MRNKPLSYLPVRVARDRAALALGATLLALSLDVSSASNLGGDGYPAHSCGDRPSVPARPENFETEEQIKRYNDEVDVYNESMERFVECIRLYVANAGEDIKRIRQLSREAVDRVGR